MKLSEIVSGAIVLTILVEVLLITGFLKTVELVDKKVINKEANDKAYLESTLKIAPEDKLSKQTLYTR